MDMRVALPADLYLSSPDRPINILKVICNMVDNIVPLKRKLLVALGVALVYFSTFSASDWLRGAAQNLAGPHPYEGLWIFIPHLLFYTTFTAALAGLCWMGLARKGAMDWPPMVVSKSVILWALLGGAASVLATLGFLHVLGMGQFGWLGFDGWKIAGNAFSNFYEEFIYRGFLLAGLTVLFGFWPAAVLSSLAFGFSHDQYPLAVQLFVAGVGVFWCWIVRRTRSIWAAWGAHMLADVVIDAIWG
jgi:membrane protease YdiL (CAAX protease family)